LDVTPDMMRDRLKQGDRREVGAAGSIADAVRENPALLGSLIAFLDDDDPILVAHSAHALMQVSRTDPSMFGGHVDCLLRHLSGTRQWEIGEQVPKILTKTRISDNQLASLVHCLEINLDNTSTIAAASALQAIVDLVRAGRFDGQRAKALLDEARSSDRKALAARARRLQQQL